MKKRLELNSFFRSAYLLTEKNFSSFFGNCNIDLILQLAVSENRNNNDNRLYEYNANCPQDNGFLGIFWCSRTVKFLVHTLYSHEQEKG